MLGRTEHGAPIAVDLLSAHTVIQGQTRSGKSVALYGLLSALAETEHVAVVGIDPTGVLLSPWLGRGHDDLISICEDSGSVAQTLRRLTDRMDQRIRDLLAQRVDKLSTFNADIPRYLIVVEELSGVYARADIEDKTAAKHIRLALTRLVLEGLKVGFSVVLCTQKALAAVIGSEMRANARNRVSFAVDDSTAVELLHADIDAASIANQMRIWPPGRCLMQLERSTPVVAQFQEMTYQRYLHVLESMRCARSGGDQA